MQILARSNPRGRTRIRSLFSALAFLVLAIGGATLSRAQSCGNVDSIYDGGQYCIAATTALSGNNPEMPVLSYAGSGGTCSSEYIMELDFQGDSFGNGQSYGYYDSGSLPANSQWIVNWSSNQGDVGEYSEGGNGDLEDLEDGGLANEFAFSVWGQNPSTGSITTALGSLGPPWWYGHTLTYETSSANPPVGNIQFYLGSGPTGYLGSPVFGGPDGFGLSQLDGSPNANASLVTDDSLWTWTTNLMYGVQVANGAQSAGASYWASQLQQIGNLAATLRVPISTFYPKTFSTTYCSFAPAGTGRGAYSNGYGVVGYNAGPAVGKTGDNYSFASVNPSTGQWYYYDWGYATSVCNSQSYTMPQ